MIIEIQKSLVVPDAVYCTQAIFQTSPIKGRLVTSCHLSLAAAKIDVEGTYSPTGQIGTIYIQDIDTPEADISKAAEGLGALFATLMQAIDAINKVKKVL